MQINFQRRNLLKVRAEHVVLVFFDPVLTMNKTATYSKINVGNQGATTDDPSPLQTPHIDHDTNDNKHNRPKASPTKLRQQNTALKISVVILTIFCLIFAVTSIVCSIHSHEDFDCDSENQTINKKPKNIILLIGDGMGTTYNVCYCFIYPGSNVSIILARNINIFA